MTVTTGDQPDTTSPAPIEDRTQREGLIRDLYAIAAFYVAHPEHPLPDSVSLHHYVTDPRPVEQVAHQYKTTVYGDNGVRQTSHELPEAKLYVCMIVRYVGGQE